MKVLVARSKTGQPFIFLLKVKSKFVEPFQQFYVRHWSIWRLLREVKMLAPALRDEPAMKLTDLPQAH
jgi:hypothetical protein